MAVTKTIKNTFKLRTFYRDVRGRVLLPILRGEKYGMQKYIYYHFLLIEDRNGNPYRQIHITGYRPPGFWWDYPVEAQNVKLDLMMVRRWRDFRFGKSTSIQGISYHQEYISDPFPVFTCDECGNLAQMPGHPIWCENYTRLRGYHCGCLFNIE